jgi:hypothetical protein
MVMVETVTGWQNMANIRGQTWTKTERIKEETGAAGTVIEWQMWNILEAPDQDKDREY